MIGKSLFICSLFFALLAATKPLFAKTNWDIYVYNQVFKGNRLLVHGKLFVDKNAFATALKLDPKTSFTPEARITVKGKDYVWLPAAARLATALVFINADTGMIDVTKPVARIAMPAAGGATMVEGGKGISLPVNPAPMGGGGGGY